MRQSYALYVSVLLLIPSCVRADEDVAPIDPETSMGTNFRKWDVLQGREARLVDREREWLRFEDRDGASHAVPLQAVQGEDRTAFMRAYREQRAAQMPPPS